jgi:hypothetical protein
MKKYFYPIIALLILGVFTSCLKDYDGPPLTEPIYTGEANFTIADLRARFGHVTEPTAIGSNFILRAYVAANDISGNLFSQLYLQDETGGIIINIGRSSLFNDFRVGQEVFIHLRELSITTFGGQIQIGFAGAHANRIPWEIFEHVAHRNGWPQADRVTPRLVTLDALDESMMATLVQLDNVFFEGGGEEAFVEDNRTTNRTLTDFDGNSIVVRTSNFAGFSSDILPEGAGTVLGMLTLFNNDWQLIIRTTDDLIDFGQEIPTPPEVTVIFNETFGDAPAVAPFPTIADFTGFETTGIGSEYVAFVADGNITLRSSAASSGYPGASSRANAMFVLGGATLFINDIATCGAQNLVLSFGTNTTDEWLSVAYRINGTEEWIPIPFNKTTDRWGLVDNLPITLPEGTNTFRLRFTAANQAAGATNVRIDDVRITTTDETGEPIIDPDDGNGGTTPPKYVVIFNETFGNPTGNILIANYTGWETTGIGAATVTFVGTITGAGGQVDVRTSSPSIPITGPQAGIPSYTGASGGGNVLFNANVGGMLYVNTISLYEWTNLVLSFGTNQTSELVFVYYSVGDTNNWIPLSFSKTTGDWDLVDNVGINVPVGTETISLRFRVEPVPFGARIDDVRIIAY